MRKKLLNEKRAELKALPVPELIERITSYPDQDLLNRNEDGSRRKFPTGEVAQGIRDRGYQLSEKQYYALIHNFSAVTVPEMKVVGVTFRENHPQEFQKTLMEQKGTRSIYEMDYRLTPEPDNPYDANAIRVSVQKTDGSWHQIGYLNKEFAAEHPLFEEQEAKGYLRDYSNGHLKRVSYALSLDTEELDRKAPAQFLYEARGISNKAQGRLSDVEQMGGGARARMTGPQLFVYTDRPLTQEEQRAVIGQTAGKNSGVSLTRVDTRIPDLELTDEMLAGIGDLSLDKGGRAPEMEGIRYERSFTLTRELPDPEGTLAALNRRASEVTVDSLNGDLDQYTGRSPVTGLTWELSGPRQGTVCLPAREPLSDQERYVADRALEFDQQSGGAAAIIREASGDFRMTPFVPENRHLTLSPSSLALTPEDFDGLAGPDAGLVQ